MVNSYNWQGFRWLAWAGILVAAAALVFFVLQRHWQGALTLSGIAGIAVILLFMGDRIPAVVNLLVIVAALVNAAAYAWNLYQQWWWTDRVVHSLTIFTVTVVLGVLLVGLVLNDFRSHPILFILAVASFGIAVGTLWEIAEWGYDQFTAQNVIKGKWDTMVDLTIHSIGALLGGWLTWSIIRRNRLASE